MSNEQSAAPPPANDELRAAIANADRIRSQRYATGEWDPEVMQILFECAEQLRLLAQVAARAAIDGQILQLEALKAHIWPSSEYRSRLDDLKQRGAELQKAVGDE